MNQDKMPAPPRLEVGNSLLEALQTSPDVQELAKELLCELSLENVVSGVSIATKLTKVVALSANYLLTKKLLLFLQGLGDIPREVRQTQISKLTVDPFYREQVGENLLLLFQRLNDMRKPAMVANAWRAYFEGTLDADMLFQLTNAVEAVQMTHLPALADIYNAPATPAVLAYVSPKWREGELIRSPKEDGGEFCVANSSDWRRLEHLANCGLLSASFKMFMHGVAQGGFQVTDVGKAFVDVVM